MMIYNKIPEGNMSSVYYSIARAKYSPGLWQVLNNRYYLNECKKQLLSRAFEYELFIFRKRISFAYCFALLRSEILSDYIFIHLNFLNSPVPEGSRFLLQGIFPTQGSNPGLPHCRWIL